jgi:hypothetical protein
MKCKCTNLLEAGVFHQDGMDLSRTMNAADQDLFDIRRATGPGDEHHGAARSCGVWIAGDGE